jgi:segregation and condensation protein B
MPTTPEDSTGLNLEFDSFRNPPEEEGISLDSMSQAFAAMLSEGEDPYRELAPEDADPVLAQANAALEAAEPIGAGGDDDCPISPRSILEAMLFVGSSDNRPLASEQVARMMRGVRREEIDELVVDLNRQYRAEARPYSIVSDAGGYRLALNPDHGFVAELIYGRPRGVRLSPAAIEVLAIVAYNGPVTAEQVTQTRGTASGAVLSQLVRRQLVRIERSGDRKQAATYLAAPRFFEVFGLSSLADLPRSREVE